MKHVFHRVWRLGENSGWLVCHPRSDSIHNIYEETALACAAQRQGIAGVFRKIAAELGTATDPWPAMRGF